MRTKTHVWKAAQRMQRVSVAMAGVVPLLSRFTCAHLRQVLSVSTLCLFSVSVGVQLVCNFVPAQRTQRVSVAMAGVVPLLSRFTGAHLRRVRITRKCSLCQLCATCV